MTFHTFPIACLRNPVNPPRSVFSITLLHPQDDTSDVIPRHTMLRHAHHVSATRNFRLNPKEVSGLSSLALPPSLCIPASLCPTSYLIPRWRDERVCDAGAHEGGSQARVEHRALSPPTQKKESDMRPRCAHRLRPRCARPAPPAPIEAERNAGCVLLRRRTGFSTHRFHVKHASTDQPSAPGIVVPAQ